MLKTVAIHQLKPNPFRRLEEYTILREKVDALKESITQTGFWGTIVGRGPKAPPGYAFPQTSDIEIAFGHHRMVALQELFDPSHKVQVIVRDLSDDDMMQMMARENMEEWGTSAWVEIETVRAAIDAYGAGRLKKMPPVPKTANKKLIRYAPADTLEHPFTESTIATYLGWTAKNSKGSTLQPSHACVTAFDALDMIDAGLVKAADLKGLNRAQVETLLTQQQAIHDSEIRVAEQNEEQAARAREEAAKEELHPLVREQKAMQAKVYTEQAESHRVQAKERAAAFAPVGADIMRGGKGGSTEVKKKAEEIKAAIEQRPEIPQVNDIAKRIQTRLHDFANDGDTVAEQWALIRPYASEISSYAAKGLGQALSGLIGRLERMQAELTGSTCSHTAGTGVMNGQKAISNGNGDREAW